MTWNSKMITGRFLYSIFLQQEGDLDILFVNKKQIHVTAKQRCTKCCACKKNENDRRHLLCKISFHVTHTKKNVMIEYALGIINFVVSVYDFINSHSFSTHRNFCRNNHSDCSLNIHRNTFRNIIWKLHKQHVIMNFNKSTNNMIIITFPYESSDGNEYAFGSKTKKNYKTKSRVL